MDLNALEICSILLRAKWDLKLSSACSQACGTGTMWQNVGAGMRNRKLYFNSSNEQRYWIHKFNPHPAAALLGPHHRLAGRSLLVYRQPLFAYRMCKYRVEGRSRRSQSMSCRTFVICREKRKMKLLSHSEASLEAVNDERLWRRKEGCAMHEKGRS